MAAACFGFRTSKLVLAAYLKSCGDFQRSVNGPPMGSGFV